MQGQKILWTGPKGLVSKVIGKKVYKGMALTDTIPNGRDVCGVPAIYENEADLYKSVEDEGDATLEKHGRARQQMCNSVKRGDTEGTARIGAPKSNKDLSFIHSGQLRPLNDADDYQKHADKAIKAAMKAQKKAEDKSSRLEKKQLAARNRLLAKSEAAAAKKNKGVGGNTAPTSVPAGSSSSSSSSSSNSEEKSDEDEDEVKDDKKKEPSVSENVTSLTSMSRNLADALSARTKSREILEQCSSASGMLKCKLGPLRKLVKVLQTRTEPERLSYYPTPSADTNAVDVCKQIDLMGAQTMENLVLHLGAFQTIFSYLDAVVHGLSKKDVPGCKLLSDVRMFLHNVPATQFTLPPISRYIVQRLIHDAQSTGKFGDVWNYIAEEVESLGGDVIDLGVVDPDMREGIRNDAINNTIKIIFSKITSDIVELDVIDNVVHFIEPFVNIDGPWKRLLPSGLSNALSIINTLATRRPRDGETMTEAIERFHSPEQALVIKACATEQGRRFGAHAASMEIRAKYDDDAAARIAAVAVSATDLHQEFKLVDSSLVTSLGTTKQIADDQLPNIIQFVGKWADIFAEARQIKQKSSRQFAESATSPFSGFVMDQTKCLDAVSGSSDTIFCKVLQQSFSWDGNMSLRENMPDFDDPAFLFDFTKSRIGELTIPLHDPDTVLDEICKAMTRQQSWRKDVILGIRAAVPIRPTDWNSEKVLTLVRVCDLCAYHPTRPAVPAVAVPALADGSAGLVQPVAVAASSSSGQAPVNDTEGPVTPSAEALIAALPAHFRKSFTARRLGEPLASVSDDGLQSMAVALFAKDSDDGDDALPEFPTGNADLWNSITSTMKGDIRHALVTRALTMLEANIDGFRIMDWVAPAVARSLHQAGAKVAWDTLKMSDAQLKSLQLLTRSKEYSTDLNVWLQMSGRGVTWMGEDVAVPLIDHQLEIPLSLALLLPKILTICMHGVRLASLTFDEVTTEDVVDLSKQMGLARNLCCALPLGFKVGSDIPSPHYHKQLDCAATDFSSFAHKYIKHAEGRCYGAVDTAYDICDKIPLRMEVAIFYGLRSFAMRNPRPVPPSVCIR